MLIHNQSYCILSDSELLRNIVVEYLYYINENNGVFRKKSLYGKFIEVSNFSEPNKRTIVFSFKERVSPEFKTINIDEDLVEIVFTMYGYNIEANKDFIKYIKRKIKNKNIEVAYYSVCALMSIEMSYENIDKVFERQYTGVHTTTEMYSVLIEFINNPNETNLFKMLQVFNSYQRLINTISVLLDNTPSWVTQKFGDILGDAKFVKDLLRISLIVIKSETQEQFIVSVLKELIY